MHEARRIDGLDMWWKQAWTNVVLLIICTNESEVALHQVVGRASDGIGGDKSSAAQRESKNASSREGCDGHNPDIVHFEQARAQIAGGVENC